MIVAVNKIDRARRAETVAQLVTAAGWPFPDIYPVSALEGNGLDELVAGIAGRLDDGPRYYPEGVSTDQPEALVIGELIREKFLERLREELPHSLVVRVEEVEQREDGTVDIAADVIVERESQKGIVIGKGGSLLRDAGTEARHDLESLLGAKVNLMLRAVIEKDWQRRPQLLDRLGFEEG